VDTARFDPARRSARLRSELAPGGEVIAGYVGRLAAEKRLDLLSGVAALPGVRLVIVGAGPGEAAVRRALPGALFLGLRQGDELARVYASLDVFVHSGPHETFGNTLQEAAASGLPVVAPATGGPIDLGARRHDRRARPAGRRVRAGRGRGRTRGQPPPARGAGRGGTAGRA